MIDIRKKAQSLDEPPMPPIVPTAPPYAVVVGYEVPMVGAIIEVPTVGIVVIIGCCMIGACITGCCITGCCITGTG